MKNFVSCNSVWQLDHCHTSPRFLRPLLFLVPYLAPTTHSSLPIKDGTILSCVHIQVSRVEGVIREKKLGSVVAAWWQGWIGW